MDDRDERPAGLDGDPLGARFLALRDRLVGTAYFVVGDRQDALEAVQEAFLRCWRARTTAPALRDLDAWLFSVVLNTARDFRRRARVRRVDGLPVEEAMQPVSLAPEPPALAERHEAVTLARAAIERLPEAEREVFLLRQNGELTFEAIAATLRVPVGTAKTRMRSALRRLREALERRSGSPQPMLGRAQP
jgi:RNA polymerase sigma-70 factor (ECF subfamily)